YFLCTTMNDGRPAGHLLSEAPIDDAEVMRLRMVHRAAADLRRGIPVLLTGEQPLILLAAETAGPPGLLEFASVAAGPALLLLAPLRAAAVLRQPAEEGSVVALSLGERLPDAKTLRGLADPTADGLLTAEPEPAPTPTLAKAAVTLAKLGRLLPAVLAATVGPGIASDASRLGLFSVPAADLDTYPV